MENVEAENSTESAKLESNEDQGLTAQVLNMPWRARIELKRLLAWPYIRLMFKAHGIAWESGWRVFGMPIIQRFRGSKIILGDDLDLRSWPTSNPLMPNHPIVLATRGPGAVIKIGKGCGLT